MTARPWALRTAWLALPLAAVACQRGTQLRPQLVRAQPPAASVRPLDAPASGPATPARGPSAPTARTAPDLAAIEAVMESETNPAMTKLARLIRDEGSNEDIAAAADALVASARQVETLGDEGFAALARALRHDAAEVSEAAQSRDRRRIEHGFWHVRMSCTRCHDQHRPIDGPTAGAPLPDLPARSGPGEVSGAVALDVPGVRLDDLGPLVAYLEPKGDAAVELPAPTTVPRISQRGARFEPAFMVVSAGQTVAWPNDDRIAHNVYSTSAPGPFDLGLYPQGEERRLKLEAPGVMRIHCSVHSAMNALILVTPTPLWAIVEGSDGSFRIPRVPAGDYVLTIWNDVLPERKLEVVVEPEQTTKVNLPLDG